ncbi:MAG: glycosyltransferase family 2 protein [Duncaniella sp.]|nr:glycosyltransferase family 2 protein [Duncaniella sp.]
MTTALIITTYNSPDYLRLVLESVAGQSMTPDEVIVADDGSREDTRAVVDSFRERLDGRLRHVWQPDEGFQLSRIRNKAIAAVTAEYIIMIDGDMLLHREFVRDHVSYARRGTFVAGMRSMLTPEVSRGLVEGSIEAPLRWLSTPMEDLRVYSLRAPWLTPLLRNHHQHSVRQLIGSNLAFWRKDAVEVNGFEESFTSWGEEDREFAARLFNKGLRRRNMIFAGIQYHLYHPTRRNEDTIEGNGDKLREAMRSHKTRATLGLDQWTSV